jgi:hypothetical protein
VLGRTFLLFTGGRSVLAFGAELPQLVARFAVEDDDAARRTGAQALYALARQLQALGANPHDLSERADKLTRAAPLDYAPQLREALERAVDAIGTLHPANPATDSLIAQAREAVQRIARDRPFELQRPAVQDALRLISDALIVAARSGACGR